MNTAERKIFWNTLTSLDGQDRQKDFEKLKTTLIYPKELCKFKKVNEFSIFELLSNQFYIPSAIQYDDPFDSFLHIDWQELEEQYNNFKNIPISSIMHFYNSHHVSITQEKLEKSYIYAQDNPLLQKIKQSLKTLRSQVQANIFSISFTEKYLNENLWLKYADSHKGFCIVYDLKEKLTTIEKNLFPIYYSTTPYNATTYAQYLLLKMLYNNMQDNPNISNNIHIITEEITRLEMKTLYSNYKVSLIKKECHQYDQEWRYLSSNPNEQYLKWKPSKIIIGLRTPTHHKELIKNSAKIAGIQNIEQVYINEKDELDTRPIQ